MKTLGTQLLLPALAVSLVLGIAGCSSKDGKKPATQVAAKVNAEEISVHQINFVLGRSGAGAIPPEQAPKVRREILEKLIDQQLAVEQALDKKLDRSPDVVMAIEAARRDILARAYVEQLAATASKPTDDEAKKYYAEHPQLFAERHIFNIQEIILPASAGVATELTNMTTAGKPMDEIANWLKGRGIKFTGGAATRPAEQIPLELLPKIHALKDGQGLVINSPQTLTVMRLVASQSAPVPEAAALPRIQQYLGNQRAGEVAAAELKQLKAKAKIAYVGEFAEGAATTPAPEAQKTTPVATENTTKPKDDASLEKGVAGLK